MLSILSRLQTKSTLLSTASFSNKRRRCDRSSSTCNSASSDLNDSYKTLSFWRKVIKSKRNL
jgi:hypothetical protein